MSRGLNASLFLGSLRKSAAGFSKTSLKALQFQRFGEFMHRTSRARPG
jgi:hypothetical protein